MIYVVASAAIFWVSPIYEAQYMFYTQNYCWLKMLSKEVALRAGFILCLDSYSELISRTPWHFLSYSFTFSPFNMHIIDKE